MGPDVWVKLLFTYGPFALLVFFVYIVESRTRTVLKDQTINRKLTIPIYVVNWGVIFTLMAFSLSAWYRMTFHSEYTIYGSIHNLQGSEALVSKSPYLYLHKQYGPAGHFDYDVRLISSQQLSEGQKIPFTLQLGNAESEKDRDYDLIVHSSYYKGNVDLRYDRQKDKLFLADGVKDEELQPSADAEVAWDVPPPPSWWNWKAQAQAAQQQVPIQERLESGDPLIRRQARQDLQMQKTQQWSYIEGALANPYNSNRVKYGVISALSSNNCSDLSKLTPSALQSVALASGDNDPSLRDLARHCLVAQASPAVDAALDTAAHSKPAPTTNPAELAKTQLDVLYLLGIQAKDRYGSRNAADKTEFEKAVKYFARAWDLRTAASSADQVIFAKALYGWGLALHDRSWIDHPAHKPRNPAQVKAAQQKFAEFLSVVRSSPNPQGYPYPQHLRRAEAYLKNPEPQSLQIS